MRHTTDTSATLPILCTQSNTEGTACPAPSLHPCLSLGHFWGRGKFTLGEACWAGHYQSCTNDLAIPGTASSGHSLKYISQDPFSLKPAKLSTTLQHRVLGYTTTLDPERQMPNPENNITTNPSNIGIQRPPCLVLGLLGSFLSGT